MRNVHKETLEELRDIVENGIGDRRRHVREHINTASELIEKFKATCEAKGTAAGTELKKFMIYYCENESGEFSEDKYEKPDDLTLEEINKILNP